MTVKPYVPQFWDADTLNLLQRVAEAVKVLPITAFDGLPDFRVPLLAWASVVQGNVDAFDEYTPITSQLFGSRLREALAGWLQHKATQDLEFIFLVAYRLAIEYRMAMLVDVPLLEFESFFEEHIAGFPPKYRSQVQFVQITLPSIILRGMLNHPSTTTGIAFNKALSEAKDLKDEWDNKLSQRIDELKRIETHLKSIRSGYNFVGLVGGFEKLRDKKLSEARPAFWTLVALGVVMMAPLVAEYYFFTTFPDLRGFDRNLLIYLIPPAIAFELIALYFFRVVLMHFRSVKAQMLQLDLRIALCQFIESYSEYAGKMRNDGKNSGTVDKFEALIFSGLISNDDKLPSTFDGTDQLAALMKAIRGN